MLSINQLIFIIKYLLNTHSAEGMKFWEREHSKDMVFSLWEFAI